MKSERFVSRGDLPWFIVFSLLFAAAIGVASGDGNHLVYLLPGLHAADTEFLSADWFVTRVQHPHAIFNSLVELAARADMTEVGLAAGTLAQSVVLAAAIWMIARRLYDAPLLPWAITLMVLGATGTRGIGLTLLTTPQLEASTMAGVASVVGLALLASDGQQKFAGLAFGLAAVLHAHFAVLIAPVVAVATGVVAVRRGIVPAVAVLLPVIVLGAPSYLQVLQHGTDPLIERAGDITLQRFPHHHDPRTWGPLEGLLFAGILATGIAAALLRRPRSAPTLLIVVGFMAAATFGSLLVGYTGLSRTVMQLFPWRLASIVIVFAVLAAAAVAARPPSLSGRRRRPLLAGLAVVALGTLGATALGPIPARVGLAVAAAMIVAVWRAWAADDVREPPHRAHVVALGVVLAGFVPGVWHGVERSHFEVRPEESEHSVLYEWVSRNTPRDAVFAVPPGWIDFRLGARRAIVADHKSPPSEPAALFEWVERIEVLTGLAPRGEAAVLDTAYLAATCDRVERIRHTYGVHFVIRRAQSPPCGHPVYSGTEFSVVDVAGD